MIIRRHDFYILFCIWLRNWICLTIFDGEKKIKGVSRPIVARYLHLAIARYCRTTVMVELSAWLRQITSDILPRLLFRQSLESRVCWWSVGFAGCFSYTTSLHPVWSAALHCIGDRPLTCFRGDLGASRSEHRQFQHDPCQRLDTPGISRISIHWSRSFPI